MRCTGQEVILRLTTVPAGYAGGNALRHLSHVIDQLWKQQISIALQIKQLREKYELMHVFDSDLNSCTLDNATAF